MIEEFGMFGYGTSEIYKRFYLISVLALGAHRCLIYERMSFIISFFKFKYCLVLLTQAPYSLIDHLSFITRYTHLNINCIYRSLLCEENLFKLPYLWYYFGLPIFQLAYSTQVLFVNSWYTSGYPEISSIFTSRTFC